MPLAMANIGDICTIVRIKGRDEQRHFLESLGFVIGEKVSVISKTGGNLIVSVKQTRVAVSNAMANKIYV